MIQVYNTWMWTATFYSETLFAAFNQKQKSRLLITLIVLIMWESPKALVRYSIVSYSFYMFYTTELALYTRQLRKMGLFSCHMMHSGNRIGDKRDYPGNQERRSLSRRRNKKCLPFSPLPKLNNMHFGRKGNCLHWTIDPWNPSWYDLKTICHLR